MTKYGTVSYFKDFVTLRKLSLTASYFASNNSPLPDTKI